MEKKYAIQGIIGCALFGVGDWLLGFVDHGKVEGDVFYFISALCVADDPHDRYDHCICIFLYV